MLNTNMMSLLLENDQIKQKLRKLNNEKPKEKEKKEAVKREKEKYEERKS